jgi:hypothetical protein
MGEKYLKPGAALRDRFPKNIAMPRQYGRNSTFEQKS